jgi:acyl-coenzyme A synthetase/AMP-(fatty) acid ligase
VPDRFNFVRDVVDVLARDRHRQALTFVGRDGIIEPRTFLQVSEGAARWATLLREHGVSRGDRVLLVVGAGPDWIDAVLGCLKVGAVAVPCAESLPATALDVRVAAVAARVVAVAGTRTALELPPTANVGLLGSEDVRREARRLPKEAPTDDTGSSDPALVTWTAGRTNGPRGATHTHAAIFAARQHAQHWLDAGPGDVVWCSAPPGSPAALWSALFGPWSRGAEVVLSEPPLDPVEEIDLVRRLGVTTLWRTPGEYAVLAESNRLERLRAGRLRRLVSTGSQLPDVLVEIVEERTGLAIRDGYGQAETGVIVAQSSEDPGRLGSIGVAIPGYEVAVVDAAGRELPAGEPGDIALRAGSPSLFAGYWNAPASTKAAFRGDWYVTGDVGARDSTGALWLAGRAGDLDAATLAITHPSVALPEPQPQPEPELQPEPAPPPAVRAPDATGRAITPVAAAERSPAPSAERSRGRERLYTPLWARVVGAIWLILLGVLIGGAAIPHASDEPRLVPRSAPPSSICLAPSARK